MISSRISQHTLRCWLLFESLLRDGAPFRMEQQRVRYIKRLCVHFSSLALALCVWSNPPENKFSFICFDEFRTEVLVDLAFLVSLG